MIRDNDSFADRITFEREFEGDVGIKHCVSYANGTNALYLAMAALDVKPGDGVITTAHS